MFKTMMICNVGRTINTRDNVGFAAVSSAKRGVTLVEVMIALVILLIVFMGLIQASIVSIDSNMRNALRDEAVRVTADELARLRAASFDDMDGNGVVDGDPLILTTVTTRDIRNIVGFRFTVDVTICGGSCNFDAENKLITIDTTWDWKERTIAGGNPYRHTISTIVRL